MSAKKIAVCVMSRANYGRLKSVIDAIIEHPQLELQLICGCSCLNLPYNIDAKIDCLMFNDSKGNMAKTEGLLTIEMVTALERLKPDIVLVHGDRYEVLACAVAASYMGIPLAHTEGGEVTGCIDDKVRNAITALADIHLPVTNTAANRINKTNVHVVGSPALDTLTKIDLKSNRTKPYILILYHPNTTKHEPIEPLIEALNMVDIHKVWINPNTDAGNKDILKRIHSIPDIEFVKDLPPEEYYKILNNCLCAVGNSSSFIKEGAFLGVPVVMIGNRQQGREHANNIINCGYSAIQIAHFIKQKSGQKLKPNHMFGDGTSSKKIVDILARCNYGL